MLDAIQNRRSIRRYHSKPVEETKIQAILQAGLAAPSANHRYPWEFIVVKKESAKNELAQATPWASFAAQAAFIIVVLVDENSSEWLEDGGIVAENMVIEGVNQDLGSCFVQVRGHQSSSGKNSETYVRQILAIPEHRRVLFLLPFGYPAEEKQPYSKEELKQRAPVYSEKYGLPAN